MKLLSMAATIEQWLAEENQSVTVNPTACLHNWNKAATCDRCIQACPATALTVDDTIQIDENACVQCGLCLHICPVGAFSGADGTAELLNTVAHLPQRNIMELACAAHPQAARGPSQSKAVIQTKGCLAALGPAAMLSLFTLGVSHLMLRLDACTSCPLGQVKPDVEKSFTLACQIAARRTESAELANLVHQFDAEWPRRQVTAVTHPIRSRRDFFKSFVAVDEPSPLVRHLTADGAQTEGKSLPRERQRLLAAWQLLPAAEGATPPSSALEALSFAQITANDNCTACGVCARVCPTDALQLVFNGDADRYHLAFIARNCVDCGLCLTLCEPNALQRQPPSSEQVLAEQPEIIQQGALQYCPRCKAGFASSQGSDLCPVCTFRQQHPFGSRLMEKQP